MDLVTYDGRESRLRGHARESSPTMVERRSEEAVYRRGRQGIELTSRGGGGRRHFEHRANAIVPSRCRCAVQIMTRAEVEAIMGMEPGYYAPCQRPRVWGQMIQRLTTEFK